MNEDQHIHELIDQYLNGKLIGEEMDLFRIRLREDKSFLRQVELQKAIIEHIEGEREAELRALLTSKKKSKGTIFPMNRRILSVAALLLTVAAMSLVFQMYLPMNDLVNRRSPEATKDKLDTNSEKVNESVEMEILNDSSLDKEERYEDPKLLAELEEDLLDEVPASEMVKDDDNKLSTFKESEDKLDATNIKPQKDQLLASKKQATVAYEYSIFKLQKTIAQTSTDSRSTENMNEVTVRAKDKKSKKTTEPAKVPEIVEEFDTTLISNVGKTIHVEFWKSIVNFKGYYFDGSVLKLYEVNPETKIQVVTFQDINYMKWGGALYRLNTNAKYESFSRVTDAEILNTINK